MKRFFERTKEKALTVSAPPVSIVAFGDSVTQGVMEHNLLEGRHTYHALLQESLDSFFPNTTFSTYNAGVSGDNVQGGHQRVFRDVTRLGPDLVLIAFGLNDSLNGKDGLPRFEDGLRKIVGDIKAHSAADIMLLTPPHMAEKRNPRIHPEHLGVADQIIATQTDGIVAEYGEIIRKVAGSEDIPLVDIYQEWTRLKEYGLDTDIFLTNGLNHPDQRGHRIIAQTIFNRILIHYFDSKSSTAF